jgi:hypothetical protein
MTAFANIDALLKSPSLAAKKVVCPLYSPSDMDFGDSLYFRAMHTLKLLEVAEIYRSKGYTILSLETKTNSKGESDMVVEKDGLRTTVELKPRYRLESWDVFQAVLYAEPGMGVDLVDGAYNIGQLDPDRVEEIKNMMMRRLSSQLQNPVPSKLCKYCSNYKCMYNNNQQFIDGDPLSLVK